MSLTRVASTDHFERERRGSNVSQHRRMSFNPVAEWAPPKEDRRLSLIPAAEFEEVSKSRRGGKYFLHRATSNNYLTSSSPGYCCHHLLPLRCWHCLRLCCYQACSDRRRCISRSMHRARGRRRYLAMPQARDPPQPHVYGGRRIHQRGRPAHWHYT